MSHLAHRYFASSALAICMSVVFIIASNVSAQSSDINCTYATSEWGECLNGTQYRQISSITPEGCYQEPGSYPSLEQDCSSGAGSDDSPFLGEIVSRMVCNSYTTSDWSVCRENGTQTRTITGKSPEGCIDNPNIYPDVERACTYVPPAVACTYDIGNWSECNSSGKQYRTVTKSPAGCVEVSPPATERSCNFTNSQDTILQVSCSYSYGSWSECSSSGKQTRSVVKKEPLGCVEYPAPVTQQACVYNVSSANNSLSNSIEISNSDSAEKCAYQYSEWGQCQSDGTRSRQFISKSPAGCVEYTSPVTKQICTYSAQGDSGLAANPASQHAMVSKFGFMNLSSGLKVRGSRKVEGKWEGADAVDIYLFSHKANSTKFVGSAYLSTFGTWIYNFDSKLWPNGRYDIFAITTDSQNKFESERVSITIANVSSKPTASFSAIPDEAEPNHNGNTSHEWQQRYFGSPFCNEESECGGLADPDRDGLNNNDEYRYRTNPKNNDSDEDSFSDGEEIANNFNPLKASAGDQNDKIIFENAKEKGAMDNEQLKVRTVEVVDAGGAKKLQLSGSGIAGSYISIFLYSDPIVLSVKADEQGNWSYVLDGKLDDGEHQVYVAITDNTGKIASKSEPLAFVKTAEAATIINPFEASVYAGDASPSKLKTKDILLMVGLILGGLALALAAVGLVRRSHLNQGADAGKIIELHSERP